MGRSPSGSGGQGGEAKCDPLHPGAGAVLGLGQARWQVAGLCPLHPLSGVPGDREGRGVHTEGTVASPGD